MRIFVGRVVASSSEALVNAAIIKRVLHTSIPYELGTKLYFSIAKMFIFH